MTEIRERSHPVLWGTIAGSVLGALYACPYLYFLLLTREGMTPTSILLVPVALVHRMTLRLATRMPGAEQRVHMIAGLFDIVLLALLVGFIFHCVTRVIVSRGDRKREDQETGQQPIPGD